MIFTPDLNLTEEALMDIRESQFVFFLTGSRFFETAKADSDYDFFLQDSEDVRDWLDDHAFEEVSEESLVYPDPLTGGVYKKGEVHVQLTIDAALKRRIQECLKESGLMHVPGIYRNKLNAHALWQLLIRMAQP